MDDNLKRSPLSASLNAFQQPYLHDVTLCQSKRAARGNAHYVRIGRSYDYSVMAGIRLTRMGHIPVYCVLGESEQAISGTSAR